MGGECLGFGKLCYLWKVNKTDRYNIKGYLWRRDLRNDLKDENQSRSKRKAKEFYLYRQRIIKGRWSWVFKDKTNFIHFMVRIAGIREYAERHGASPILGMQMRKAKKAGENGNKPEEQHMVAFVSSALDAWHEQ